ncbi:nucleoporin 50kDa [Apostichopus japonicus]|uniref:Nucleoporin 50kDa n=1 Tax=Stichopus japonicus TaxID=307972 RepID=A0A2G8L0H8_STIJA|nr:nucleoporin 50kDa [Apostichopus japonicus]
MAAKRRAGSQLTQDNWEDDDEDEVAVVEMGVQIAEQSVLAKRKIKRAHRRLGNTDGGVKASPFGGFKGFASSNPSTSAAKPTVGSGFQVSSSKTPLGSGFHVTSSKPALSSTELFPKTTLNPTSTHSSSENADAKPGGIVNTALNGSASSPSSQTNPEYRSKLRALNVAVSSWIQQHVAKTPVCDLTPIFNDYRKHLTEIERKYGSSTKTSSATFGTNDDKTVSQRAVEEDDDKKEPKGNVGTSQSEGVRFLPTGQSGSKAEPQSVLFGSGGSKLTFGGSNLTFGSSSVNFGNAGTSTGNAAGFSFTGATATQKKDQEEQKEANDDEDEPPKVEVKQVEEKDAIFSIRSKLYYKKDGAYKERGVGMLHIKKLEKAGQLMLRADTSLGNIIFNISIPKGLPVERQGKNNVILMAPMNPPADKLCPICKKKYPNPQTSNRCESDCSPEPTAILLRVKTGEDADRLKEELDKVKE